MKTTHQNVTILDATWQRFKLYEELTYEIGKKPLTFKGWLKRYEAFNPKRATR